MRLTPWVGAPRLGARRQDIFPRELEFGLTPGDKGHEGENVGFLGQDVAGCPRMEFEA